MRLHSLVVIVLSLSFLMFGPAGPWDVRSQSENGSESWEELVEAFRHVQQAEREGASSQDILQLVSRLNLALTYHQQGAEGNSTAVSTETSARASTLRVAAENEFRLRQFSYYTVAGVGGVLSALVVTMADKLASVFRRRSSSPTE